MDYVGFHASFRPAQPAVTDLTFGRDWSYAGFDAYVARQAALLRNRGIAGGDRVACLAKNRAEIAALHLACARLGALFVPLNWRLSAGELQRLLATCAPRLLITDGSVALDTEVERLAADALHAECLHLEPAPAPAPEQTDDTAPSLILFTSGTSGAPKGVLLSERNIVESALNFSLLGNVTAASVFLCDAPMFHVIGLVTTLRAAFLQGARVLISDGFDAARTLARLGDTALGITHYFCVPQMAQALRREPGFDPRRLRRLTAIFTGGAPHSAPDIRAWLDDGIAVVDGYGMSEAGTVFGMPIDPAIIAAKAGSVGIPTPRLRARIVDAQGGPTPRGTAGELQLAGASICCGYWPAADIADAPMTTDGWFRTGDTAVIDGDGFYRIVGRQKEMFISGGENIYPAEIEVLATGIAGIADCAVVGVPDAVWGEVGCFCYVPQGEARLSPTDLAALLAGRLARYKMPKQTRAVARIPRNAAGKIIREELALVISRGNDAGANRAVY